ncbi:MAG: integration host factor subunit beta [Opitutales bacterium]|nr:integration host factor subunit beta [Opitutales bacterium]
MQNLTNLTKREIVQKIYTTMPECLDGAVLQNDVKQIVQMTLDIILDSLSKGRNVELRNFGVLEVQVRKPRVGRNPTMPENDVVIPKRAIVKFKSGKELKAALKKLDLGIVESAKKSRARK